MIGSVAPKLISDKIQQNNTKTAGQAMEIKDNTEICSRDTDI